MSNQYPPMSDVHAADELNPHGLGRGPESSMPPPANPGDTWTTDEVMAVLQDERAQRDQQQQELTQWQHYAQQLQSEHAQLQAQFERVSQSTGNSIPPGTVGDEHAQNLELQLQAAESRIQSTEAELEAALTEAQVAQQQLRMLQDHVDSVPPPAAADPLSGFPSAPAAPLAPALEADDAYVAPTGQRRGVSMGVMALLVTLLVASGAGAYFGVFEPQLAKERETTRRTQELMRTETERLRDELSEQRAASAKQVGELQQQLTAAKTSISAAVAPSASKPASASEAAPSKPAAKSRRASSARKRKAAARRRAAKRRRSSKRRGGGGGGSNDPIAGIGL